MCAMMSCALQAPYQGFTNCSSLRPSMDARRALNSRSSCSRSSSRLISVTFSYAGARRIRRCERFGVLEHHELVLDAEDAAQHVADLADRHVVLHALDEHGH